MFGIVGESKLILIMNARVLAILILALLFPARGTR
jgi:hypothetical protein